MCTNGPDPTPDANTFECDLNSDPADTSNGQEANVVGFGLHNFSTTLAETNGYAIGTAQLLLGERTAPYNLTANVPTGWVNTFPTLTMSAQDDGLGVYSYDVSVNGTLTAAPVTCAGYDPNSVSYRPCPQTGTSSVSLPADTFREGENAIRGDRQPQRRNRVSCAVSPRRRAGVHAMGSVQAEEVRIGTISGTEQVAIEVQAVDGAGNVSPTGSGTVTVAPDLDGPVFEDIMLEGGASPSGYARISWLPPTDPESAGSTAAGSKDYQVRFRRPGEAWSARVTADYPWLELQGAALGDSYELELQARDWADNFGPTITATVQLGAFEGCDAGNPDQVECPAGSDDDDIEENADGDVTGELESAPPRSDSTSSFAPSYDARRYRLQSNDSHCVKYDCYATFRSYAKSWVTGLVRIGHRDKSVDSYVYAAADRAKYYYGELSGISDGICRWVGFETTAGGSVPRQTSCDPNGPGAERPNFSRFQYPVDYKGNNCFSEADRAPLRKPDGTRASCGRGTALFVQRAADLCPDVGLVLATGRTRGCRSKRIRRLSANSCVDWRYITADGNWVMVTDTFNTDNEIQRGGWGFVPRSAFSKYRTRPYRSDQNTGGWPGIYQRGTCANPDG